jgi:hypothetical protein
MDIRAYVDAVGAVLANGSNSTSAEKLEWWSNWALAAADRIDRYSNAA